MEKNCILEDPSLGIITENDHKLGLCLCSRCTCGKHICASKNLFSSFPLKLKSTYNSLFITGKSQKLPKTTRSITPIKPKEFKGESTYKLDFIKHDSTPNPRFSHSPVKPSIQLATLKSSYTKDFINYHPEKPEAYSPVISALPSGGFKFAETTTYKTSFTQRFLSEKIKSQYKNEAKLFVDPNKYIESSHQRDYQKLELVEKSGIKMKELKIKSQKFINAKSSSQRDYSNSLSPVKNFPRRLSALRGLNF